LHRPSVILVSFIENDIARTESRRLWWRDKPWFAIEEGGLALKGVPVPNRTTLPLKLRNHMAEILFRLPFWLQQLVGYHARVHPAGHGLIIVQRLLERLARLRAEHDVKIVVVAQYSRDTWTGEITIERRRRVVQSILSAAAGHGLATLDTYQRFATEPEPLGFYKKSHMNARGNAMIASLLAATLPTLLESQTVKP
jgi:hypothetical protein